VGCNIGLKDSVQLIQPAFWPGFIPISKITRLVPSRLKEVLEQIYLSWPGPRVPR